MPLNSVQAFIRDQLNDLPLPGQPLPLACYISPPSSTEITQPLAFIWSSSFAATRHTAPRTMGAPGAGGGHLRFTYQPDIWVYLESLLDQPDSDRAMPLIIDAIMAKLLRVPLPGLLVDPQTSQTSQLIAIGERWTVHYSPVRAMADERLVLYQANVQTTVEEWVVG